ncbi:MAG: BrnA antitoxin family protein [Burkholderiales bacterium]
MKTGKTPTKQPKPTGTDWERVKREAAAGAPVPYDPAADAASEPYDPNDAAAAAAYWAGAIIKRGRGRPAVPVKRPTLNMRVDADVLEAFKATGPGWQTRINALLRDAVVHGRVKG